MDYTREPVIETVITPKEGCKLVIRNSKGVGQEEYFVDAVEVITFGSSIFFRSLERPKPFLLPASDYEVLEVREARMVLKNVGIEKNIKISGGRESPMKAPKESQEERQEQPGSTDLAHDGRPHGADSGKGDGRGDRRRDRRRGSRRRRERPEGQEATSAEQPADHESVDREEGSVPFLEKPTGQEGSNEVREPTLLSSLLAPPPLISETISRYKEKFKEAFYSKEEQEKLQDAAEHLVKDPEIELPQPTFGSFEISEEAEEEIYRERRRHFFEDRGVSAEESVSEVKVEEPQKPSAEERKEPSSEEGST